MAIATERLPANGVIPALSGPGTLVLHQKVYRFAILSACVVLAACGNETANKQQAQAGPPPAVLTETVTLRDFSAERSFTGRVEAIDKVQVRARVQGFLKVRHFEEGSEVKVGGLLFEIEPESFETVVRQAEANLASAQAGLVLAQQTFDRSEDLASRGTTPRAQLDAARASLLQAQSTVQAREADLQTARLNLSYARINAPIDGRIGRAAYSVGNLVGPDSGTLAVLVKQDPVYVTFPVPTGLLLQVRRAGQTPDSVFIRLRLSDGSTYEPEGAITFADVQATAATDSVNIRATIANPKRVLIDQQLVEVHVVRRQPQQRLAIPQSALLLDQQGAYVLVVDGESKVQIKRIVTGEQQGPSIIVETGLSPGDRVIVSGHQRARPGIVVNPQEAKQAASGPAATKNPVAP